MSYKGREDPERRRRRSIVIKENDRIAADIVKYRDGYVCQMCGKEVKGRNANWSHIVPRTHWAVRWYTPNQFCACYRCHVYLWHGNPLESAAWAIEHFGTRYLDDIKKRDVLVKVTDEWVDSWNKALRAEYFRITGSAWEG